MTYREILDKRNTLGKEIEGLKTSRAAGMPNNSKLNSEIKRKKFQYNIYNKMLKSYKEIRNI